MRDKMWRRAWPFVLILGVLIFCLRDVLALPGTLGHSWDWEISAFAPQILGRLTHDLFVWDYQIRAGYYNLFRTNGWFSLLTIPFSFLGGEVYSRLYIVLPMFLAAVCMRWLARSGLGLGEVASVAAGVLYMLSPVVFSRILTGHSLLFAYALLPLLVLYSHRTFEGCRAGRLSRRDAVIAGLALGAQGIHPAMMVLAFAILGIMVLFGFLGTRDPIRTLLGATIIVAIFGLLNIYWLLPMGAGYLASGTLYHSGSVVDAPDQVTASTVINQRATLQANSQQVMQDSLRQNAVAGYNTEFDFPVPGPIQPLWIVASFLIPLAAFGTLVRREGARDLYLVLALSGLLGATLVSGSLLPAGAAIYQWLMLHAFPVWAEFGSTVRALPLVALAYSALAPALFGDLPGRLGNRGKTAIAAVAALALLVYISPFLAGWGLVDPSDVLTVRAYQPSAADRQVYDYFKSDQADFRITYVPPPWIYYPENYDLGYQWIGGLSPHPEFFVPYFNPKMWASASDFRQDIHPSISGKLLGLAAVKYVVYPRARFVNPALGISLPPPVLTADYSASARFADQVLDTQPNLTPVSVPFTGTLVYRNQDYAPHIYAAEQSTLVLGDSNALPTLADSTFFKPRSAFLFDSQLEPQRVQALATQVDRVVSTRPEGWGSRPDGLQGSDIPDTAFLFPMDPFTSTVASFDAPREQAYTIRVQTEPYQLSTPGAADSRAVTFDRIDAKALAGWSGDLLFDASSSSAASLKVAAYLDPATSADQYAQLDQPTEPIKLADMPYLRLTTEFANADAQAVAVQLRLDLDGDGVSDAVWTSPPISHVGRRTDDLNVLALVRQAFPGQAQFSVVGLGIRFQKKPLQVWKKASFPANLYNYAVEEVGFRSGPAATGQGWSLRFDPSVLPGQTATVSRPLNHLDAQRFPLRVEYDVDGPAPLFIDMQLLLESGQGLTRTVSAGAEMLRPFSHGVLTVDPRGAILSIPPTAGEDWAATNLQVTIRRLSGSTQLRPTTFVLGRVGAGWLPRSPTGSAATDTTAPVLTIDGEPVALAPVSSGTDHQLYAASLTITAGRHQALATSPGENTRYGVDLLEISPSADPPRVSAPPTVTFENINPTRFRVHVANATAPYLLVFSDNFHAGWSAFFEPASGANGGGQASSSEFAGWTLDRWYAPSALLSLLVDGGQRTEITDHLAVNGFANAWRVDKPGSYDIVLEFMPQRVYEGGWIVSLGTFVACVSYLAAPAWRRRRGIKHV